MQCISITVHSSSTRDLTQTLDLKTEKKYIDGSLRLLSLLK